MSRRYLSDQLLVRQPLADNRIHERIEALECVAFDVPFVQPKSGFLDVSVQVLGGDVVINPMNPALQDGPHRFDTVRGSRAPRILARRVVDRLMPTWKLAASFTLTTTWCSTTWTGFSTAMRCGFVRSGVGGSRRPVFLLLLVFHGREENRIVLRFEGPWCAEQSLRSACASAVILPNNPALRNTHRTSRRINSFSASRFLGELA